MSWYHQKFHDLRRFFLVLLLIGVTIAALAEDLVLAKDGQPVCTVVWGRTRSTYEEQILNRSVTELQHVFRKMTGGELPAAAESALANAAGARIYLGATEFAKQHGIDPQALKHEEAVVKVADNALILVGNDRYPQIGTLHATTLFLQKDLGVRWLWPGELGEVIPKRAAITLPGALERREVPSLKVRYWRDVLGNATFGEMAMKDGWTLEELQKRARESEEWSWRNRLQRVMGIPLHGGHAYEGWYARFGKTHPEYFAVQPCGKRDVEKPAHPEGLKLCDSEPAVVEQIAADIEEAFQKDPQLATYPLGPNDGGWAGHCMCARCKAWDEPDAEKMIYTDTVTGNQFRYVAISDRVAKFYNAVAERVLPKHPGLALVGHGYCAYGPAPLKTRLRPGVVIMHAGESPYLSRQWHTKELATFKGWVGAGAQFFWRPNWLPSCTPASMFVHRFAKDLKLFVDDYHLVGAEFDTQHHFWGAHGLDYYGMVQLMWNVNQDVDAVIADYCKTGFGKAAPAVAAYFAAHRKVSNLHYEKWKPNENWFEGGPDFYDAKFFEETHKHLNQAAALAAKDAVEVQQRVQFLADALTWMEMQTEIMQRAHKFRDGDESQKKALANLERRRLEFYRQHKHSWILYTGSARYYEKRYATALNPIPDSDLAEAKP